MALYTNLAIGCGSDLRLHVAFHCSLGHGVNIDLSCGGTMVPDMVRGSSPGLVVSIVPGATKATAISMAPAAAWIMDPNKDEGSGPGH